MRLPLGEPGGPRFAAAAVLATALLCAGGAAAEGSPAFDCLRDRVQPGANDRTLLGQSYASCARACADWSGCASFDFGYARGGDCYLSGRAVAPGRLADRPGYMYCARTRAQACVPTPDRFDCFGDSALEGRNDRVLSGVAYGRCEQECRGWAACQSFDHARGTGTCFLSSASRRNGTGRVVRAPGFLYCEKIPGRRCPARQPAQRFECRSGLALRGANDRTLLGGSEAACARACREWQECRSYDYGVRDNGVCYLSKRSVRDGTGGAVRNPRYRYCQKVRTW